jgi:hypothetical protein
MGAWCTCFASYLSHSYVNPGGRGRVGGIHFLFSFCSVYVLIWYIFTYFQHLKEQSTGYIAIFFFFQLFNDSMILIVISVFLNK